MQSPWGDCAVSDAHIHFFSRRFFETLAAQPGKTAEAVAALLGWELPAAEPAVLAHRWVLELDAKGVSCAALIASIPGDESSVAVAAATCRGRFLAYAMVNPLAERHPCWMACMDSASFPPCIATPCRIRV
jgi:hypothetical protein